MTVQIAPTSAQRAARSALGAQFGPAIIWGSFAGADLIVATDTRPCLRLQIDPDGNVTSPLDSRGLLVECDEFPDGRQRVDRVVADMARAVDRVSAPGWRILREAA